VSDRVKDFPEILIILAIGFEERLIFVTGKPKVSGVTSGNASIATVICSELKRASIAPSRASNAGRTPGAVRVTIFGGDLAVFGHATA
jgi:hypothetical protein